MKTADVLSPETYNEAERIGRHALPARVLEVFQPVTYASVGYPVHVDDISELWKYADAMQERRTEWIINDLLGGLTEAEFTHAEEINKAVCALSREHFGRRMVARSSLLRAINTLRHILHLCGDQRPAILEVGPGSGYLGAMLLREGFPYVATEVTQAFYLYQHMLWDKLVPGGVTQLVTDPAQLSALEAPEPGRALHIPWWHFYDHDSLHTTLRVGLVTCNHVLCEMHPRALHYLLQLTRTLMDNSAGPRIVAFENYGSQINVPAWYVNSRFYRYGYAVSHHDDRFTVYAEPSADRPSAQFPNVNMRNLEHANAVHRFGEQTVGTIWEPQAFYTPQNALSARILEGRAALQPVHDLTAFQHMARKLAGPNAELNEDERFWTLIDAT
jgi:hypothetical protein